MRAIEVAEIGPNAGSCGTAVFMKEAVYTSDIATDPRWDLYRAEALQYGLRACWSIPILSSDQRVLGTFAFYYREPREPTPADRELAERASRVAAIAIEHAQMEEKLRDLSAHVEAALEAERTRIAREIHDDLGQSLTALKMDIAWLGRHLGQRAGNGDGISTKLAEMSSFTDGVIQRVRSISAELRPGVLDDLGLVPAIEWQAQVFEQRAGKICSVHSNCPQMLLERDVATAAFRIFQEALTNVVRHAEAERVDVRVDRLEHELLLEVRDDGVGISGEAALSPKSLGLVGIRERAQRLGGRVTVEPLAERGTRLELRIPLRTAVSS
jgi:signal transduction histidine kinase